jgi:hypothetical protein
MKVIVKVAVLKVVGDYDDAYMRQSWPCVNVCFFFKKTWLLFSSTPHKANGSTHVVQLLRRHLHSAGLLGFVTELPKSITHGLVRGHGRVDKMVLHSFVDYEPRREPASRDSKLPAILFHATTATGESSSSLLGGLSRECPATENSETEGK